MDTTRVFLAVAVGDPAHSVLKRLIQTMGTQLENIRWTQEDQLHLTLKFLGEVDNRDLPSIIERMHQGVQKIAPFGVEVEGLGSFPEGKSPRVVWAGIQDGHVYLQRLHETFDDSFHELGFAREPRKFTPHLTLGRVGRGIDQDALRQCMAEFESKCRSRFEVDEVLLMSSERERGRYVYQTIETAELR